LVWKLEKALITGEQLSKLGKQHTQGITVNVKAWHEKAIAGIVIPFS
jgi:hypothetical protein